jgi:hypothetical protein
LHYATPRNANLKLSGTEADRKPLATLIIDSLVTCATIAIAARAQPEVKSRSASGTHRGTLLKAVPRAKQIEGS